MPVAPDTDEQAERIERLADVVLDAAEEIKRLVAQARKQEESSDAPEEA